MKIPLRVVGIDGYLRDGSGVLIDLSNNEILETFITGPYGFVNLKTPTYALPEFFKVMFQGGYDITLLKTSQLTLSNISSREDRLNLREAISSICFFLKPLSHLDFPKFFASTLLEGTTKPNSCFSCIELGS